MRNKFLLFFLTPIFGLLVWLYYSLNPAAQNSFFPGCPTYRFLGLYCPGCGSQRALHYLLHGQMGKALRYNLLFVIMLPAAVFLVAHYVYEKFTGQRIQIKIFENRGVLLFLFAVVMVYFIARNLPYPQLEFLRPPGYAL